MKYDTTPLSIDTAGVDLTPPEQELRFVPEDDHPDSGPISQQTVIASPPTQIGYSTFIEPPPQTNRLDAIKEKLEAPKYRTWAFTALLASISAVAGGLAVVWVSADRPPTIQSQPQLIVAEPVTDIQTNETFVPKQAVDSAAGQPLLPHMPEVSARRERPLNSATQVELTESDTSAANNAVNEAPIDVPTTAKTEQAQPEREAKVGAYIVEKPAGRKPLARCSDGTYSFSASKSAACAGRGGVSEWMSGDKPSTVTTPAKQAAYILGPRGGCYYLDSSSKKIYVEKKYCQ